MILLFFSCCVWYYTHPTKSMLSIFLLWSMMAPGFWLISPVLWSGILESINANGNMSTNLKHLVLVMLFNSITLITLPYFTLEDWVIGHSVYIIHKILSRQKRRLKAFKQAKGVCRCVFLGRGDGVQALQQVQLRALLGKQEEKFRGKFTFSAQMEPPKTLNF